MLPIIFLSTIKALMVYNIHVRADVEIDEVDASYLYVYYALIYYENKDTRIEQFKSLIYNKKESQEIFKYFANIVSVDFLSLSRIKRHTIFAITGEKIELIMRTCDEQLQNYITSLNGTILSEENVDTESYPENYLLAIARFIVELLDQSDEEKKLLIETLGRNLIGLKDESKETSKNLCKFVIFYCDLNDKKTLFDIYYNIFTRFQKYGEAFQINCDTGISQFLIRKFGNKARQPYILKNMMPESNYKYISNNSAYINYLTFVLSCIDKKFLDDMHKSIDNYSISKIKKKFVPLTLNLY